VGWWCAVLAIGAAGPPAPRATQTRLMQAAGQRGSGVAGERDVSRVHLTVGNRFGYRGNRSYRSGSVRKKLGNRSLTEPSKSLFSVYRSVLPVYRTGFGGLENRSGSGVLNPGCEGFPAGRHVLQEAVWNGITDTGTKGCVKRENRESKMQRRCKKWCLEYRNTKSKYWKH
jgi:hypothetical protein